MIERFDDIKLPLQEAFKDRGAGDTLVIWDRYFIGDMNTEKIQNLIETFLSVSKIANIEVFIDTQKLISDSRSAIKWKRLLDLNSGLAIHNIRLSVFDYASGKDPNNRIHGRYWMTKSSGFLMDGSINGIGKDLSLAILMDEMTFQKMSGILKEKIEHYCHPIDLNHFPDRYSTLLNKRSNYV
jgi:hypothetical protein